MIPALNSLLLETREKLASRGVSQEILNDVFGNNSTNHVSTVATCTTKSYKSYNFTSDNFLDEACNSNVEGSVISIYADNNSKDYATHKNTKVKNWAGSGKVIIVIDYGPRSHALFGDFGKTYVKFKDHYIKNQQWLRYNGGLAFGQGWVITKKEMLGDLRNTLKNENIPFQEYTKPAFEKEMAIQEIPKYDKLEIVESKDKMKKDELKEDKMQPKKDKVAIPETKDNIHPKKSLTV
jgi:hypothetical protein